MNLIVWQYCKDPNDINTAIMTRDSDWEGLTDASQIISITWDSNHGCYVVFWRVKRKLREDKDMTNCADLESELTMLKVAEKLVKADLIQEIIKLPTHEYREYDGHDEVVIRECVYLSDLMELLRF